jgi:hypothetical protein
LSHPNRAARRPGACARDAPRSGFWAPPRLPSARFPTPTPHSTNMPQPCCPSASPAACWSRVRCSLQHLQRATQRCRSSTSDRRLSVCLRPHALDENSIRSEEELTMMQMPWDAMSSSAKTFGSLRTATQALQGSAQVGNIVRRGNKGGGAHLWAARLINGPETIARRQ